MERYLQSFIQLLKDPQKKILLLAALFFIGILFSAYSLFMLPHNLVVNGGMTSSGLATWIFAKNFLVILIAFMAGIVALNAAYRLKKEVIVFKEASTQTTRSSSELASEANSVDKQTFLTTLRNTKKTELAQTGLNSICELLHAGQGALYLVDFKKKIELKAGFALVTENETVSFEMGEGLVGQAASSGKSFYLDELPEGYSNMITSGLGSAAPKFLFITPVKKEEQVNAVLEIATFKPIAESDKKQATELATLLLESL